MMIECVNICKAFDGTRVLRDFSTVFIPDEPAAVTGPSGSGKTTLLRLILGLEKPDSGVVRTDCRSFGVCFQEDRLFPGFNAVENIRLATGIRELDLIKSELLRLLPEEALEKSVSKLSGGQKRRVSIVMACLASSDALILDEPFAGLDGESAGRAREYILEMAKGKILIIAAHGKDVPDYCEKRCVIGAK